MVLVVVLDEVRVVFHDVVPDEDGAVLLAGTLDHGADLTGGHLVGIVIRLTGRALAASAAIASAAVAAVTTGGAVDDDVGVVGDVGVVIDDGVRVDLRDGRGGTGGQRTDLRDLALVHEHVVRGEQDRQDGDDADQRDGNDLALAGCGFVCVKDGFFLVLTRFFLRVLEV